MKKLILLLFIPLLFTCSSDSSDENSEPVLGVDNLSEYLEGKYFYYSFNLSGGGGNAIEIFNFQENGVRDVVFVCGAFGGVCNSNSNGDGGCHSFCSTITSSLIIDLPDYMEYSNGNKIGLVDGEIFYRYSGVISGSPSNMLVESSLEEQNTILQDNSDDCGFGNC